MKSLTPQDWMEDAACTSPTADPDWWYSNKPHLRERAAMYCLSCPVREQCAEAGKNEQHGIWGGELKTGAPEYPTCKGDCGRALRPVHTLAADHPGTIQTAASGHCRPCWDQLGERKPRRSMPTHCEGCARRLRPGGRKSAEFPGTVAHHSHGRCGACVRYGDKPRTTRPEPPRQCTDCGWTLRPRHVKAADAPSTREHKGRGMCGTCYDRDYKKRKQNK